MAESSGVAKTIDQLPEKTSVAGTDMIPIDDGAQSYRVLWSTLLKLTGGVKTIETSNNTTKITLQDGTEFSITQSDPAKQDKLTFDSAPTKDSTNPVTSGGVYTAVGVVSGDLAKEAETARAAELKNSEAIDKLNGDSSTAGSVAQQVNAAITKLIAGAPASLDTLKEISEWISTHAESAAAMNTQINTNKKDIAAIKPKVLVYQYIGSDGYLYNSYTKEA